jgi:hypothetical protein
MKSVSGCVCVHGQVMDLNLGDPGVTVRVDDLLRMDGDTTIEQEKEGDESGMSLGGEGMCTDGATEGLVELRKYYDWIDKQNEVGKEECMSDSASTSIGGGNKRPSLESNSSTDGDSVVKKTKTQHRFTRVEKTILEERLKNKQLDDRKGREDVVALLSGDGKTLSGEQVRIWVDNFRSSLKRKKDGEDKQSESNDKV